MSIFSRQTLLSTATLLLLFMTGCGEQQSTKPQAELIRPVKIFQVKDPASEAFRNFPAEAEANTESKLAFRVSGQVITFPIKAGNEVSKGQLLAQLDPKDFKLLLDDRQARYELAKSQFKRAKLLLEKKLASQADYDQARANLSVSLSSLNTAKTDLEYTSLRAPFSGNIAKVMVENHENVQAKQTILALQTRDLVDISMQMPENIASRVNKNVQYQPTVIFDSHPAQEFLVSVKEWDTQADPITLTYKVVFSLPSPKTFNVLPGMTANIRMDLSKITNDENSHFLLPVSAVFTGKDSPVTSKIRHIWKFNPETQTVTLANVTVGGIKSQGIEVLTGLEPGDQVVSAGVHFLREGMKVRPWNREKGL